MDPLRAVEDDLTLSDSNDPPRSTVDSTSPRQAALEVALVFVVFFLQGARPVPEVNEPYYLGKSIHFWNPDWAAGDFFLETTDTHRVFYFSFGWLSLLLPPMELAWAGRILTWGLLAWSWRRLSMAVLPRAWLAVLTAALFVCLQHRCHMAGEWVIGGVEAKGFAYVLVFLGLEALARGRWNRTWLLFGAASAFHVLVGGWSVVAAAIAWILAGKERPSLSGMIPALLGGLALSLPGLIPALRLTWGLDPLIVDSANRIYVFGRLGHHLVPASFPMHYIARLLGLAVLVAVFDRKLPRTDAWRRLRCFVTGTLAIALVGVLINFLVLIDEPLAAGLLRFYWFRLVDVFVPLAVALLAVDFALHASRQRSRWSRPAWAVILAIAIFHVGGYAITRPFPSVPPADRLPHYASWRLACNWVAEPGNVPPDARFLTPVMAQTFRWYTGHAEVVNWKEIPQDARGIVRWWIRLNNIYRLDGQPGFWPLASLGADRLRQLGEKYDADYVITRFGNRRLELPVVYQNEEYVIYRLTNPPETE